MKIATKTILYISSASLEEIVLFSLGIWVVSFTIVLPIKRKSVDIFIFRWMLLHIPILKLKLIFSFSENEKIVSILLFWNYKAISYKRESYFINQLKRYINSLISTFKMYLQCFFRLFSKKLTISKNYMITISLICFLKICY